MIDFTKVLFFLLVTISVNGQYQIGLIPRVSPDKGVYQKIGYTEIEIKYGSPLVKNRRIWGDLLSFNEVWRAGANNATTIEFSNDVFVEGQALTAGKYSFFIVPKENESWIAIFNSNSDQWGAFGYDEKEDVLRIEVFPKRSNEFKEELTYSINSYGFESGQISLHWEYIVLNIDVDTKYLSLFKDEIAERLSKADKSQQGVIYIQGAEYLEKMNREIPIALEWIAESEAILSGSLDWNPKYYPKAYVQGHMYWIKAKLLARQEQYEDALLYANKVKVWEKEALYYNKKNEREGIDELINKWKEQ